MFDSPWFFLLLLLLPVVAWRLWARAEAIGDADGIAIEMVVDRSGSMQAMDFQIDGQHVDRLTAIKSVAGRFIQGDEKTHENEGLVGRVSDLGGLVTFAGFADALTPPALDHAFVLAQLNHKEIVAGSDEAGTG